MRRITVLAASAALSIATLGCDTAVATAPDSLQNEIMALFSQGGPNPRPTLWAGGELYGSVVTPTSFSPSSGNFDELYTGTSGFKDGVPLISDAAPGDTNFNGGRWHVNLLKAGVDPAKYSMATSVADLDLADFESHPVYFECPVLPRRGNN